MSKRAVMAFFMFVLIAGFYTKSLKAQAMTNQREMILSGTVVDASTGEAIADVEVMIKDSDYSATTDSDGHFSIEDLKAGHYVIIVEHDGYKKFETSVDLTSENAEVTIKLEPTTDDSMR